MLQIEEKHLTNGQYLTQVYKKIALFYHHTISTNPASPWRWWNSTPQRVGTAYIVGRGGEVIECFDPTMWAWHLGVRGDDNYMEKHSIGIELVSAGPLKHMGGEFRFYPLWPDQRHFTTIPEDEVYELDYKGELYWHKYTDEQIETTIELTNLILKANKGIKVQKDLEGFYQFNEDVVDKHLPGLWAHSTVRKDKSDIYPDMRLIEAIGTLKPKQKRSKNKPRAQKEK